MADNNPYIQRQYKDYSLEPFNDEEAVVTDVPKAGNTAHFPSQLYIMLTNPQARGYSHICSWQPHGRAFKVWDRGDFVEKVLPQHFRQTQYTSFQRQLNLYGFSRIVRKGDDYKAYYHELFLRGRFDLCKRINRVKSSTAEERRNQKEPDFSQMAPVSAKSGEHPTMKRQDSETPKSPAVNNTMLVDATSYRSIKLAFATKQEYLPSSFGDNEEQGTRKRPTLPIDFHYPSSKRSILTKATANDLKRRETGLTDMPEQSLDSAGESQGRERWPHYLLDHAPAETVSTETEQFLQLLANSSAFAANQRTTGLSGETTQSPYDQPHIAAAQGVFDNNLHFRSGQQETLKKFVGFFPSLAVTSQKPQRSLPTSLVSFLASPAASAHTNHSFDLPMNNLIDQGLADPLPHSSFSATVTANTLMNPGLAGDWIMYSTPTQEQQQLQGQESDRKRDASTSNLGDDNQEDGSYEEKCSMVEFLDDIYLSSDDDCVNT